MIYVGTAGWTVPKAVADRFSEGMAEPDGSAPAIPPISNGSSTHLQRYARRFTGVEINTSFYRPHRPATYARWASSVPPGFRFAVKVPKEITHTRRLAGGPERLESFLAETAGLGGKLGPLLIQLPPSLRFDGGTVRAFFAALRQRFAESVVCEPRHASWFEPPAEELLFEFQVARAATDPAPHPLSAAPAGWPGLVYYRLHGSPVMYASAYSGLQLDALADRLAQAAGRGAVVWCIFDNTAEGAAAQNGLDLLQRLPRMGKGLP